jgi:histidine triad (HIT) family protein
MLRWLVSRLGRALFALARSPIGGRLARRWFPALCRWLPVRRLCETETLLAFHHPRPSYPVHILLVPKAAPAGLEALQGDEMALYADMIAAVQRLVRELDLAPHGYRLIINGGVYQEVPILHAHLISQAPAAGARFAAERRVDYNARDDKHRA